MSVSYTHLTVYSASTEAVNEPSARQAASSVLRFLTRMGIIRYSSHSGYIASVIREEDLTNVKTDRAGFFRRETWPGAEVLRGDLMATIIEPVSYTHLDVYKRQAYFRLFRICNELF